LGVFALLLLTISCVVFFSTRAGSAKAESQGVIPIPKVEGVEREGLEIIKIDLDKILGFRNVEVTKVFSGSISITHDTGSEFIYKSDIDDEVWANIVKNYQILNTTNEN